MHQHSCSVQFSHSVVSNSLWPRGPQHARPHCPSPAPGVHSDSRPWSRWCHPAISSSVIPFSLCPQSLPASGSFPKAFVWRVLNLSCVLQQPAEVRLSRCSATTTKFNSSWSTLSTVCPSSAPQELPFGFSLGASSLPLTKLPTNCSCLLRSALAAFCYASLTHLPFLGALWYFLKSCASLWCYYCLFWKTFCNTCCRAHLPERNPGVADSLPTLWISVVFWLP